jgi:PcfJ-like protein
MSAIEESPRPVELLHDARGVYGIGVSDSFDYEAVAWSCGVEPDRYISEHSPRALILRPDWFMETKPRRAVLQKIVGGFQRGPFMRSSEERLRQFIHHEALNRAGLPWPPYDTSQVRWWATDKRQQVHNRAIYHGLRMLSLHVINNLIGKALEEAADGTAVAAARRFTFEHRERIYRAAALSRRALQLTETFPVLALVIYSDHQRIVPRIADITDRNWFEKVRLQESDLAERKRLAAHMVDLGTRLRDVAAVMNVPTALRRIKPAVAHLATDVFCQHPELLNFMPATAPQQRIWLRVIDWAFRRADRDFGGWAARHLAEIPGRRVQEVGSFLSDLADWACAEGPSQQFVTRPFTPSISLKTATALSADWHEAVASHLDGPTFVFPPPWYPTARIGKYDILPIVNSADLYREGVAMHHCVGTYADDVRAGRLYVYSVRRDNERVATLALALGPTTAKPWMAELRGPCNAQSTNAIATAVQRWLRAQGDRCPHGPLTAVEPPLAAMLGGLSFDLMRYNACDRPSGRPPNDYRRRANFAAQADQLGGGDPRL